MPKYFIAAILMLVFTINLALSAPAGRHLPSAEKALVVERVFSSPVGEVEFTSSPDKKVVFLRTSEGALCPMTQLDGEENCQRFAGLETKELPNARCVFHFKNETRACQHQVFSYELREIDLFGISKSATIRTLGERGVNAN
jgi:hypothetical protein